MSTGGMRAPVPADRRVRFALVGCGRIAANHLAAMQAHAKDCELVGVCDTDPAALAKAQQATGAPGFQSLDALLAGTEADCVVLATPSGDVYVPDWRGGFHGHGNACVRCAQRSHVSAMFLTRAGSALARSFISVRSRFIL